LKVEDEQAGLFEGISVAFEERVQVKVERILEMSWR